MPTDIQSHTCTHKHKHDRNTTMHAHMPFTHTSTQDGGFPLFMASQEGHDRIVEMLLQAGATVNLERKVEDC